MVSICSNFEQLADKSCDLSDVKMKTVVANDEQIHKMTIIFTQNGQKLSFWVKIVVIFRMCSALTTVIFFSAWDKSHDSSAYRSKLEQIERHLMEFDCLVW